MSVLLFVIIYLILINLAGFIFMGIDKWKAKKHSFRIPESTFFVLSLAFGTLGTILGMFVFRHKTRHWYFLYGLPFILIIQLILIYLIYQSPIQFAIL
jgi:uncharacterized membrane protein YsdA (DUF1294 family)